MTARGPLRANPRFSRPVNNGRRGQPSGADLALVQPTGPPYRDITVEPLPDGSCRVVGMHVDEVRRRLCRRQVGRPSTPLVPADELVAACRRLRVLGLTATLEELAAEITVDCSRRTLRASIEAAFGTRHEMLRVSDSADD